MIQAEVEAREMSDTMKIQEKKGSLGTANSLLARSGDGSGIRCAFCTGEHY